MWYKKMMMMYGLIASSLCAGDHSQDLDPYLHMVYDDAKFCYDQLIAPVEIPSVSELHFKRQVLESDQLVVIKAYRPSCGACNMMGYMFQKVARDFEGKVHFYDLNVAQCREISVQYVIAFIPSFLIFYQGSLVARHDGVWTSTQLADQINQLLEAL